MAVGVALLWLLWMLTFEKFPSRANEWQWTLSCLLLPWIQQTLQDLPFPSRANAWKWTLSAVAPLDVKGREAPIVSQRMAVDVVLPQLLWMSRDQVTPGEVERHFG